MYVHSRPRFRFAPTSFFTGRTIDDLINVNWGSWDIVSSYSKQVLCKPACLTCNKLCFRETMALSDLPRGACQ